MAVLTLSIFEGRSDETKARVIRAVTDAVVRELPAKPEHVRVIINEVPVANYGVAGKTVDFESADRPAFNPLEAARKPADGLARNPLDKSMGNPAETARNPLEAARKPMGGQGSG